MNKTVLNVVGILALIAAAAMYWFGKNDSHLSELKDFWWIPLPIALICFLAGARKNKS